VSLCLGFQVIVEPGTPKGYEAVVLARNEILRMERSVWPLTPLTTLSYSFVQYCTVKWKRCMWIRTMGAVEESQTF